MRRPARAAVLALVVAGIVAGFLVMCPDAWRDLSPSTPGGLFRRAKGVREPEALSRLSSIPFYRALARSDGLRVATLDGDGRLHVEIDVRALAAPHLRAVGWVGLTDLLPASATGTIEQAGGPGSVSHEWWEFTAPAPLLDVLDRSPVEATPGIAWSAVPQGADATLELRLRPGAVSDPSLGGDALAAWRERIELVEKLLGRDIRGELAADLAGPIVVAIYDKAGELDALAIVPLVRSDRVSGLLQTVFGLGALTDRAAIRSYREVTTGSFGADPGLKISVAVDGPLFIAATSQGRLESAIDARRLDPSRRTTSPGTGTDVAWSARSTSEFVEQGWCRLAHCAVDSRTPHRETHAVLRPSGQAGWRLEGAGAAPAITADPLVPILMSVAGRRRHS